MGPLFFGDSHMLAGLNYCSGMTEICEGTRIMMGTRSLGIRIIAVWGQSLRSCTPALRHPRLIELSLPS